MHGLVLKWGKCWENHYVRVECFQTEDLKFIHAAIFSSAAIKQWSPDLNSCVFQLWRHWEDIDWQKLGWKNSWPYQSRYTFFNSCMYLLDLSFRLQTASLRLVITSVEKSGMSVNVFDSDCEVCCTLIDESSLECQKS